MHVRSLRLLIPALALATLFGCSASPSAPSPSNRAPSSAATSATPDSPARLQLVRADQLPGQVVVPKLETETRSTWQPRVHLTWPLTPRTPALVDAARTFAGQVAGEFTSDYAEAGDKAELTGTWQLVADSERVQGVRLVLEEFGGASHHTGSRTWFAPIGERKTVWQGTDLIDASKQDELVALIQQANIDSNWGERDMTGVTMDDLTRDISFTAEGGLRLVGGKGVLAGADRGMVALEINRATTDELLTDNGRTVRDAVGTLDPTAGVAPTASASASSPSATATVSASESQSPSASTTPSATGGTSTGPSVSQQPTVGSTPSVTTRPGKGAVDCSVKKCIALTFDDGPGPLTPRILDVLAKHDAKATFFVIGPSAQAAPATLQRMHQLGMAIGDHTWTHPQLTNLSAERATSEITRTADVIAEITGEKPVGVRPPYGAFTKQTPHAGYAFVLWDVDTEDWKNRNAQVTTQRALEGAHRGAIILMHDIHPSTAAAVEGIVTKLQAQGYTLVTVPELTGGLVAGRNYYSGK